MAQEEQWHWWHSHDGGERFYGPCDTRENAIAEGREQADGEAFTICEATKGGLHDFIEGRVDQWLDDCNEDNADPAGDPISESISEAEWEDLDKRLTAAADEWRETNNIDRHVWAFGKTRNMEEIPGDTPEEEE